MNIMPSAAGHLGGAVYVKNKLNIKSNDFLIGALLPDVLNMDKKKSHYKIQGTYYLIPDLEYYKNSFDLKNPLNLGYFYHLYMDYYFLEDYLENNTTRRDVFDSKEIYKDYDILNKKILDYFNVDVDELISIIKDYKSDELNYSKLKTNLDCLKYELSGDLAVLDENKFISFIESVSNKFIEDMTN